MQINSKSSCMSNISFVSKNVMQNKPEIKTHTHNPCNREKSYIRINHENSCSFPYSVNHRSKQTQEGNSSNRSKLNSLLLFHGSLQFLIWCNLYLFSDGFLKISTAISILFLIKILKYVHTHILYSPPDIKILLSSSPSNWTPWFPRSSPFSEQVRFLLHPRSYILYLSTPPLCRAPNNRLINFSFLLLHQISVFLNEQETRRFWRNRKPQRKLHFHSRLPHVKPSKTDISPRYGIWNKGNTHSQIISSILQTSMHLTLNSSKNLTKLLSLSSDFFLRHILSMWA